MMKHAFWTKLHIPSFSRVAIKHGLSIQQFANIPIISECSKCPFFFFQLCFLMAHWMQHVQTYC